MLTKQGLFNLIASRSLVVGLVVSASSAHAYLDPGTGSMILQGVIAGIAMASLTIKLYWHRLLSFFKKQKPIADQESEVDNKIDDEEA